MSTDIFTQRPDIERPVPRVVSDTPQTQIPEVSPAANILVSADKTLGRFLTSAWMVNNNIIAEVEKETDGQLSALRITVDASKLPELSGAIVHLGGDKVIDAALYKRAHAILDTAAKLTTLADPLDFTEVEDSEFGPAIPVNNITHKLLTQDSVDICSELASPVATARYKSPSGAGYSASVTAIQNGLLKKQKLNLIREALRAIWPGIAEKVATVVSILAVGFLRKPVRRAILKLLLGRKKEQAHTDPANNRLSPALSRGIPMSITGRWKDAPGETTKTFNSGEKEVINGTVEMSDSESERMDILSEKLMRGEPISGAPIRGTVSGIGLDSPELVDTGFSGRPLEGTVSACVDAASQVVNATLDWAEYHSSKGGEHALTAMAVTRDFDLRKVKPVLELNGAAIFLATNEPDFDGVFTERFPRWSNPGAQAAKAVAVAHLRAMHEEALRGQELEPSGESRCQT